MIFFVIYDIKLNIFGQKNKQFEDYFMTFYRQNGWSIILDNNWKMNLQWK